MPGKKKYTLGQSPDLFDVELPSGATCQARRPGVQGLISAGLLDNFDQLTAIVKTDHIDKNVPTRATRKVTAEDTKNAAEALAMDKEKLDLAFQMVDRLVAGVVTQPPVWVDYRLKDESPEDFAARSERAEATPGVIGTSVVDLDDKMFLVNWAIGGSSDLASFREGSKKLMADLAAG